MKRSVVHATFVIERTFKAPPALVFHAFADQNAKAKWFGGPSEWEKRPSVFEFRVGGRETSIGGPKGGTVHAFNCLYQDIVQNERIAYTYDMHLDDRKISISLTTIEFKPKGKGTHLKFTEQGAFLDGYDDAGSRESGSRWLIEKLAASLGEDANTEFQWKKASA
jgi:uncharacterized protein YndB with AHSA1/START domain